MLIGNHFGKRTPRWNFFTKSYESFKYGWSLKIIKVLILSLITQLVLLSPVIYWIYQNYGLIENLIPAQYNLHENIQFEKKWILFLMGGTLVSQGLFNFYLWKTLFKNWPENGPLSFSERPASPGEVDYQRRAS